jgi:hypothetical protein
MRVQQINYEDTDDGEVKDITVIMTRNEAIALVNLAGKLNGHAQQKLGLSRDESLFDALDGVFNQHYEAGAPDLRIDLKTINEPKS